jgi:hypothetical protein
VKFWIFGSVLLIATFASIATTQSALAQAGSTGGTIGRTDKSASGGEESNSTQRNATHPLRHPAKTGPLGTKSRYIGCYKDQGDVLGSPLKDRDLDGFFSQDDALTPAHCISVVEVVA